MALREDGLLSPEQHHGNDVRNSKQSSQDSPKPESPETDRREPPQAQREMEADLPEAIEENFSNREPTADQLEVDSSQTDERRPSTARTKDSQS